MRQLGIAVIYDGFSEGQIRVLETKEIRPDMLRLAPSLVRNLHRNRQRENQLRSVVRKAADFGCEIIAVSLENEAEADACREIGCRFGQGTFFGPPQPVLEN